MTSTAANIYQDITARTGGDIYIGVVGPVRTGKSTFVKRFMEGLVLPNIDNIYRRERAKDELPQSGSGRMIMTAEPKFVPEEAVEISPDGMVGMRIRLIDSVGYMIPGAIGTEEDGQPRMVTTPWFAEEIPMAEAAELGTKKIMDEHCTVGIVVTTDGTVTDIPRHDYMEAEARAIADMQATRKPFVILINTRDPASAETLRTELADKWNAPCLCVNAQTMQEQEIIALLSAMLSAFPVTELMFSFPGWMQVLPTEHPMKTELYGAIRHASRQIRQLCDAETVLYALNDLEPLEAVRISAVEPGSGTVRCELLFPEYLFYQILTDFSGFSVENDRDLIHILSELAKIKAEYEKVSAALEQVRATGYGIVMPTPSDMELHLPQMVRKGGNYGVSVKAAAHSIHMLRADIEAEVCPMAGSEKQSRDLMQYLLDECDGDEEKLWDSHIFGRSVGELVAESLAGKTNQMPDQAKHKLRAAVSRMVNEGCSGLICIILG